MSQGRSVTEGICLCEHNHDPKCVIHRQLPARGKDLSGRHFSNLMAHRPL